jgi:predicted MFS family arabinose efflux permease
LWVGVVTALGLGLMGMVPHVAIIAREFSKNRGLALGLAWAGGGLGIFVMIPLAQLLIEAWGWRLAYVGLAVLCIALVVIPSSLIMRDEPPAPEKKTEKAPDDLSKEGADWTVYRALTSSLFWLLFLSRVVASMGNQIITTHQVAHAVDIGYSGIFAASIFGIMGVFSIFGRILFGYMTDRTGRELVFTLVQLVSAAGILSLVAARNTTFPQLLYIYALCYGLGQGSRALVLSAISADVFLGKSFGAIYGFFTLSIGVGGAMGAWLGGFLYDVSGSYTIPFMIAFANFIASIAMVWCIKLLKPQSA